MGKRIIARARGKGGPRYRVPSHKYKGKVEYNFPYELWRSFGLRKVLFQKKLDLFQLAFVAADKI